MSTDYYAYLRSPEWAARRAYMLERAGHRCSLCDRNGSLNVHHRTYDRLGAEFDADLIVLCRDCHATFHGKLASRPWWESMDTIEYEWGIYLLGLPRPYLPEYGPISWFPIDGQDAVRVIFTSGTDQRLEFTAAREHFEVWLAESGIA